MVYRGGLENRFGLTPDGGSNPSLSASRLAGSSLWWFAVSRVSFGERFVNEYLPVFLGVAVVGALFIYLWIKGYLLRLSTYVQETKEELRKCSWPTADELKGSTVVVMVSAGILGGFTVTIDFVIAFLVKTIS